MPDISLLQPTVLMGVVEKLTAPETMLLTNRLPKRQWPYPTAQWDVIKGARNVARPNVPNSEAHIVPRLGVSQEAASFIYLREKKVFEPTTLHWLRIPGDMARRNAEQAVLREINDLNIRFDNFVELTCWAAMTGVINLNYVDVVASVDFKFPASHLATVGTTWASATPQQLRDDITAWKRLIIRDSKVKAREVFASEPTINRITTVFSDNPAMLSDRMKDEFFRTGALPGFMGLDWTVNEATYQATEGVYTESQFVADDALFMANLTDNRPMEIFEGPSADDDAPSGFVGRFSKTWKEPDPSQRQFLLEYHFLPVITRPEQFLYVADVAA